MLLLAAACLIRVDAAPTNLLRVDYIGDSVTDTIRYGEMAKLAATREG